MNCIILESRETIIGEWEWVSKDTILNTKQNREQIEKGKSPNEANLRDGFERITTLPDGSNTTEKKVWKESVQTYFEYNIPKDLQKDKLYDSLNSLNNITDMIQLFTKQGFVLANILSNSVGQSIYTKYILVRNTPPPQPNYGNGNSGNSNNNRKNWNKKKQFNN